MSLIEPRKLKGFRDYPPDLQLARQQILRAVESEALLSGFDPIHTPALESEQVLLGQGGDETDKQVYRFEDQGGRKVALRFDLTVPFARYVAEHQGELLFPLKKLQTGSVWRGEKPQKGRYREFVQCDLDIVGVNTTLADVEVIGCLARILDAINFGPFTMRLGNRKILSAVIAKFLPNISAQEPVLIAIDKLDKIGADKVIELVAKESGSDSKGAAELIEFLMAKDGEGDTPLELAESLDLEQCQRLVQSIALLKQMKLSNATFQRDISLARGLGYYTGIVFECTIDALPGFGSICGGGRYDDLISRFTKRELPGVGGSIGLDRLLAGLEDLNKLPAPGRPKVLVAPVTEDAIEYGYGILNELRKADISSDIGLQTKAAQQFKYADKRGCTWVITVGTDEVASQTFGVKNLLKGQEDKNIPRPDLLSHIKKLCPA